MKRLTPFLLSVFCFLLSSLEAATWFASATGNSTNGTRSLPWNPQYAVTNTNPHLLAGDTVLFITGTYACIEATLPAEIQLAQVLTFRKSGTPSAKITYQAESLWEFAFDGGLHFPITVSNLVLRNCRIMYSNPSRISTNGTGAPPGITTFASNVDLMHNLIENVGHPGIGSWAGTRGKYIAGNIVRFVGTFDFDPAYMTGRGSGMYLQNITNTALIEGNISYHNYTTAMKAYGGQDIFGFNFRHQIAVNNPEAGIFFHNDTPSIGVTINSNYFWDNNIGVRVGYSLGDGGGSNAVVLGNYVVDDGPNQPLYQVDGWFNNSWSNNTAVNLSARYVWFMEVVGETMGDITSHHIDRNTYYSSNASPSTFTYPFFFNQTSMAFSNWQAQIHGDTNSSFAFGTPVTNSAYAFRASTDPSFIHAAVFNWTNATTVTVNLSGHFRPGERLAIFDAQNIPVAYTNISTFNGSTLSLDLTLTNRATMLGVFLDEDTLMPKADAWDGFDPRFRAFVIHALPPVANVAQATVGTIVMAQ